MNHSIDLSPARWIWLPSERTLPNTVVAFRRVIELTEVPAIASGWITADSRYRLIVNGLRVQVGPAPADPRWPDVDPIDLAPHLRVGSNTIDIEVLYFGHGDGTWVTGKPGLLLKLDLGSQQIVSDASWRCCIHRGYRPGQYKRWYLRALQEEFDARFELTDWLPAMELDCSPARPTITGRYNDYLFDSGATNPSETFLRPRHIPLTRESFVSAARAVEAGRMQWHRSADDWFEFRVPGSFTYTDEPLPSTWALPASGDGIGHTITFEFAEQLVGYPSFTLDAPAGAVIELMFQEGHSVGSSPWLDSGRYKWLRYICREGLNEFTSLEYESLRWMQIHVRHNSRPIRIERMGVIRRSFAWDREPLIRTSDTALQRLADACVNTIRNSCIDTVVDGNGRERQQYSGDVAHQLFTLRAAFGDTWLPRRFLRTYSEGITLDGYFLDCWPGYDRCVRLAQRQTGFTPWGPIIDHGVQFVFDNWWHYLDTGDLDATREPYPRLLRFAQYLESLRRDDGLLPVTDLGLPTVWIDHDGYTRQRNKQCAFNLYVAAMFEQALAPLMRAHGDDSQAERMADLGRSILASTRRTFWSESRQLFVNNQPWLGEDGTPSFCDRSLATAVLFDQCPTSPDRCVRMLSERPASMGLSYPPNAIWRYRALAKHGRMDVVLDEFRRVWSNQPSVVQNNTLSENFDPKPDWYSQWSHAAIAPLNVMYAEVAGIKPFSPGYSSSTIQPQLADIASLNLEFRTVHGPIHFSSIRAADGTQDVHVRLPAGVQMTAVPSSGVRVTITPSPQ